MSKDKNNPSFGTKAGNNRGNAPGTPPNRLPNTPFTTQKKAPEHIQTHNPNYFIYPKQFCASLRPFLSSCGYGELFSVIPDGDKVIAKPNVPAIRFGSGEHNVAIDTLSRFNRTILASNALRELAKLHEKGYELAKFAPEDIATLVGESTTRVIFTSFDKFRRSTDHLGNLAYVLAVLLARNVIDRHGMKIAIYEYLRVSKRYCMDEYEGICEKVAQRVFELSRGAPQQQNFPGRKL
ncbi:hypothetical protein COX84_02250 [Candidatus Micrarchaeota archaeon CG_4_10_14_0_2_um_filter_49_7]